MELEYSREKERALDCDRVSTCGSSRDTAEPDGGDGQTSTGMSDLIRLDHLPPVDGPGSFCPLCLGAGCQARPTSACIMNRIGCIASSCLLYMEPLDEEIKAGSSGRALDEDRCLTELCRRAGTVDISDIFPNHWQLPTRGVLQEEHLGKDGVVYLLEMDVAEEDVGYFPSCVRIALDRSPYAVDQRDVVKGDV
jgi:hypothetical protein